jgi:hypothetical protein
MIARAAVRQNFAKQSQAPQNSGCIRPQHHSRSNFGQLRSLLIYHGVNADLVEGEGRGDSADSSADYPDAWFEPGTNHLRQVLRFDLADL